MKKHGLGQPYWNAHQVYTWVYTRNPRLVVLLSDRDKGDSVEPSVIDFIAMTGRPGAEFADYAEAQEAIVSTLQEGRLRSWGRRDGVGTLEEIPPIEWVDLHFVWYVFHGLVEAEGMTDDPPASIVGAPRWYALRFKRDDVLELWPRTETEIETGDEDPLPSPPQNRPAKEMHDRWVGRAKALADGAKKSNKRVNVSQIARTIEREDRKIKDENTKGLVRETVTIRRVLTDRRNEWDLPLES